uniref:Secreted protein n=1 Tax=Arundo donax TaxID=35708 RepID=A0A0A9G0E1_ARUDO
MYPCLTLTSFFFFPGPAGLALPSSAAPASGATISPSALGSTISPPPTAVFSRLGLSSTRAKWASSVDVGLPSSSFFIAAFSALLVPDLCRIQSELGEDSIFPSISAAIAIAVASLSLKP